MCAECSGVAAVAWCCAVCGVGLQKSITLSEPIPAQQPGAGCSKADDSLDLVNYADTRPSMNTSRHCLDILLIINILEG